MELKLNWARLCPAYDRHNYISEIVSMNITYDIVALCVYLHERKPYDLHHYSLELPYVNISLVYIQYRHEWWLDTVSLPG